MSHSEITETHFGKWNILKCEKLGGGGGESPDLVYCTLGSRF